MAAFDCKHLNPYFLGTNEKNGTKQHLLIIKNKKLRSYSKPRQATEVEKDTIFKKIAN